MNKHIVKHIGLAKHEQTYRETYREMSSYRETHLGFQSAAQATDSRLCSARNVAYNAHLSTRENLFECSNGPSGDGAETGFLTCRYRYVE